MLCNAPFQYIFNFEVTLKKKEKEKRSGGWNWLSRDDRELFMSFCGVYFESVWTHLWHAVLATVCFVIAGRL